MHKKITLNECKNLKIKKKKINLLLKSIDTN